MATVNARPKAPVTPVVVLRDDQSGETLRLILRMVPAALGSLLFHALLGVLFYLLIPKPQDAAETELSKAPESIMAERPAEERKASFTAQDVDEAALEFDTDIQYVVPRVEDVSVPGAVDIDAAVGIKDASKDNPPTNIPLVGGWGINGTGGAIETSGVGNVDFSVGDPGGMNLRANPLIAGSFFGRSGSTREIALRNGGGTTRSEAAVTRGLKWLERMQLTDGSWTFRHPAIKDGGSVDNDVAATAFGLLPFLAAGKTHRPASDNPYDKPIEKALAFLVRKQIREQKSNNYGQFGTEMYSHGLATIAICEAYGLTQDQNLRRPAQLAVNFIVSAQHEAGGWRYRPKEAGDLSVAGWQIMALKSALMAGLDVPEVTMTKAIRFVGACAKGDGGYCYQGNKASSPEMSAVGLLCRQYLQSWGPKKEEMIKGVENVIQKNPPMGMNGKSSVYYYYYATQVMHHFGGKAWDDWNKEMREYLINTQVMDEKSKDFGSWAAKGDQWARGGRLMMTSMNLLTLEVYYRYLPLYYREAGSKMDEAVQKAM